MLEYNIASGSVAGRLHVLAGKNNQDALAVVSTPDVIIGVVADGCSDGAHSEVGAALAVRIITQRIHHYAHLYQPLTDNYPQPFPFWETIRQDLLDQLGNLVKAMGTNTATIVNDYFLFTLCGFLITKWGSYIFTIGDGVYALNGTYTQIGPFPQNEPPYLGYAISGSSILTSNPELLMFQLHETMDTNEVDTIMVGSDGVSDLKRSEHLLIPGTETPVGELSQFWLNSRYYSNSAALTRQLNLINRTVRQPDWTTRSVAKSVGLLDDDTSLITARRGVSST